MHIKNFDPYDFSKKEIDGVSVYYKNLPWAPCIHIRMDFSVGAFNDPVGKEGLSHFLEHIIGNGCPSLPDKKAIKEFSRLYMLNSRNAMTSHYWTSYVGRCLPEHFEKVLLAMKDYVFNPFVRTEDIEHERKVITQEAWGRYKNDKFLNYVKEVSENVYHGHERSRIASPLGWPDTIEKITQKDVADFHKNKYVKENLSIFLVGDIDDKKIMDIVLKTIDSLPSGPKINAYGGKVNKPKQLRLQKNSAEIGNPQEQLQFSILRATNELAEEENEIIDQSRMLLYDVLFERLRIENSLCYGVSIQCSRQRDYSEIEISVNTSEDKVGTVEKEIWNVINEIIDGKWKERFSTLHSLAIDQINSKERSSDFIIQVASNELSVNDRIIKLEEILSDAKKVTYENVSNMLKKVFDKDFVFTEIILPSKKSSITS